MPERPPSYCAPGTRGATRPARRELGRVGVMTLTNAREKARKWRELVASGIDPSDQEEAQRRAQVVRRKTTFGAVAEDFIRDKLPGERKGKDVEREIRLDLMPNWENLPITEIT